MDIFGPRLRLFLLFVIPVGALTQVPASIVLGRYSALEARPRAPGWWCWASWCSPVEPKPAALRIGARLMAPPAVIAHTALAKAIRDSDSVAPGGRAAPGLDSRGTSSMTLKTVRVPIGFEAPFRLAEEIVSRFFAERREDPAHGTIEIFGERYVLVRGAALSVEFFALVRHLFGPGREREAEAFARNILFDLAHAIGKSDARNLHAKMRLDDPLSKLSAGPVHFAYAGWASVDILPESISTPDDEYCLIYEHPDSFESAAWLSARGRPDFPVCIMNAGYSSGWCEESFGIQLVSSEVLCRARGDSCCRFLMAPPHRIEERLARYAAQRPELAQQLGGFEIPDFFARKRAEEELRRSHADLETRVRERTRGAGGGEPAIAARDLRARAGRGQAAPGAQAPGDRPTRRRRRPRLQQPDGRDPGTRGSLLERQVQEGSAQREDVGRSSRPPSAPPR